MGTPLTKEQLPGLISCLEGHGREWDQDWNDRDRRPQWERLDVAFYGWKARCLAFAIRNRLVRTKEQYEDFQDLR